MSTRRLAHHSCLTLFATLLLLIPGVSPAVADSLDDLLDEIDGSGPPPPPPPPGGEPGAGELDVPLLRVAPSDYADGVSELAGETRQSPRVISNIVLSQTTLIPSPAGASDMVWQWGQFVDHDLDLTDMDTAEPAPIDIPPDDEFFDPDVDMEFNRSVFDPTTGTDPANPRQQINNITGFQDASNVYGSDSERQEKLRGANGRLLTSPGDLLPYNTLGLPNAQPPGADPKDFFVAGDVRVNEQAALTAMHTLWMREHNTVADRIRQRNHDLTDDEVYTAARLIIMAEQQYITYNEWLPVMLGPNSLPVYTGYDSTVDARIANGFATAAFRLGHTMLSPVIRRLDDRGETIPEGDLALRDAFFAPTRISDEGGIEPILRGLPSQVQQRVDSKIVDDVRNFLFGPPPSPGLDLGSLNIQRGRDHGLPDYNEFRLAYGLAPVTDFSQISADPDVQAALSDAYGNVNDIDAWVGMIAEDHVPGTLVGPTIHAVLVDQFSRLRDGNPQWYENLYSDRAIRALEKNTLFEIIVRNTGIKKPELPRNVFLVE